MIKFTGLQFLKLQRGNCKILLNKNQYYSSKKLNFFNSTPNSLEITFKDDKHQVTTLKYNPMWLRFNCHHKTSYHEYTSQRILDLDKIPNKITIKNVTKNDNNQLLVEWNEDPIVSILPIDFLLDNHPNLKSSRLHQKKFKFTKNLEVFQYSDLIKNNEKNICEIKKWINHIQTYGICLIKNVPIEPNNCRKIAEIVAPIQPNLYGDVFEIINTPKPINLALSNEKFMYHMDLPYLHDMPYVQFIQCLRFDKCVLGGESVYLNAVHVAEQFREKFPDHFKTLTEITPTFQRIHYERERPVHMVVKRKHIILNEDNEVEYVTWSPPNEGPLTNVTDSEITRYYESYLSFVKFISEHPDRMDYRMEPGDVVCFHNRKMLHSRNAFEMNGGIRHFQGCYINETEFKSQSFIYDLDIPTK